MLAIGTRSLIEVQFISDFFSFMMAVTRDGSVGPVSQYREHFTEIPRQHLKTATSLISTLMEGRSKILETYPKSEEIISFYPDIFVDLQSFIALR